MALSPSAQQETPIGSSHGVDLILGGHDHLYYISKGVTSWQNYELGQPVLGAEEDEGDVLIIKSGNDFRDLTEFTLELEPTSPGSVRTHVITAINGMKCRGFLGEGSDAHYTTQVNDMKLSLAQNLQRNL